MILVNNQIEALFFSCRFIFYSLHVPIVRRIIVLIRHLVYVTLSRRPTGMQERILLHTSRIDIVILLMMGTCLPETCRE